MITEVKAPNKYTHSNLFLAGSIENGKAEEWQQRFLTDMRKKFTVNPETNFLVLNPRRDNWSFCSTEMEKQVSWELDGLASSDYIAMYFDPDTISPISLLELGLFATEKIFICCSPRYYRYTNIKVLCQKAGLPLFAEEEEWRDAIFQAMTEEYS
jgi:hypothetical protein